MLSRIKGSRVLLAITLVKAISVVSSLVVTYLATSVLDPSSAGLFLLIISLVAALSIFLRIGTDTVVLRLVASSNSISKISTTVNTALVMTIISTVIFSGTISFFSDFIGDDLFSKPELSTPLSIGIWSLPFMACSFVLSMGFQGKRWPVITTVAQNLGVGATFLVMVVGYQYFYAMPDILIFASLYFLSAVFIFIFTISFWRCRGFRVSLISVFEFKTLWSSARHMWVATSMNLLVQWSGVLIAGIFLSASEVSQFTVAQKLATLISFGLVVANMVTAPRYARLWSEHNIEGVHLLSISATKLQVLIVLPIVALFLIAPVEVLSMFGLEYKKAWLILIILTLGQMINVICGSVAYILTMTGNELLFRRATLISGPLTLLLSVLFVTWFGLVGIAVATALGMAVQNIISLFYIRKKLGFWTFI